jgi:two-component system alkaline phosphatase synthesis response regulator PhoP
MTKILVVEDEDSLAKVLTEQFEGEGFSVVTAKNGEEGLSLALKEKPDIMLVDLIMPRMDGMTMLKQLKATEEGKKIPAVILTNLNDVNSTAEALGMGVYDYLVKTDWELPELVKFVKRKLQK